MAGELSGPTMGETSLPPHYLPATVPELLRDRATRHPGRIAIVAASSGRHVPMSYAELDRTSDRVARWLVARWRLPRGSTVAWTLGNEDARAALVVFHAVLKAGLVNVPLNTRLTVDELVQIAAHAHCRALIGAGAQVAEVGARLGLPLSHRVSLENGSGLDKIVAAADSTTLLPVPSRDDLASILYTSGTTGLPKGVEHTHESSVAAGISWADAMRLGAADVLQSPFPVFGGAGLHFNGLSVLWAGATFVVAGTDTLASWELISQWRTSVYVAVPSVYQYWLAHPGLAEADLSSLRLLDYGGASIPLPVIGQLHAALPTVRLLQTYGLTEAGPGGTYLPEEYAIERLGSLGSRGAGPFTRFRVIRDDGSDVEADEPGELVLRGPSMMRGYHRDPEATRAVLADGWLRSGDVVRLDREGFLYLVDRKKDLIVRGGYNISSVEVESALLENPALVEAAVFALPHPQLGEVVAAAVVTRAGAAADEESIRAAAARHLADFKVPRYVFLVADLPRNAAGKVVKRTLAQKFSVSLQEHY